MRSFLCYVRWTHWNLHYVSTDIRTDFRSDSLRSRRFPLLRHQRHLQLPLAIERIHHLSRRRLLRRTDFELSSLFAVVQHLLRWRSDLLLRLQGAIRTAQWSMRRGRSEEWDL